MILFKTYFLPVIGLVDPEEMKPADLVVNIYIYIYILRFYS